MHFNVVDKYNSKYLTEINIISRNCFNIRQIININIGLPYK